jgi:type I restriction enzyme S subunit
MELTKTKFKQTEVGLIPEDWNIKPMGETGKFLKGKGIKKNEVSSDGFKCVRYGELYTVYENIIRSPKSCIPENIAESSIRLLEGDILFAGSGETREEIGKSAAFISKEETYAGGDIIILRNHGMTPHFLGYLLNSVIISKEKSLRGQGDAVVHIYSSGLKNILIPIPSLTEQKAIAAALSDVDELIAKLEKLIEKKKAIKQGAMQALLTPKEDWKEFSILELADNRKDLFDDGDWIEAEHITDSGIRLIQTGNIGVGVFKEKDAKKYIYEESFNRLNCKLLQKGDLLICRLADPAGRVCIFPEIGEKRVITSVDVTIFRPLESKVNRNFLMNVLSTPNWFKQVTERVGGTTHKRISRGALGKLKVKLPSINEQNASAEILSDVDNEIIAYEKTKSKIERLKQGMMQELLTGRTRLV